ncbi:MAG: tetratricopeptide repeat protein, partial [Acidobacteriota bacterium]
MPQLVRTALCLLLLLALSLGQTGGGANDQLARHRNLGKAFFENPTTHELAAEEFRKAVAEPSSTVEDRVNFGIALLAAGKTEAGVAELKRAQEQAPAIPHTWFNLGIQYKKAGDYDKARQQLEQMARLVNDEPVTHYNLGTLYKLDGKLIEARREFELASKLAPQLAA